MEFGPPLSTTGGNRPLNGSLPLGSNGYTSPEQDRGDQMESSSSPVHKELEIFTVTSMQIPCRCTNSYAYLQGHLPLLHLSSFGDVCLGGKIKFGTHPMYKTFDHKLLTPPRPFNFWWYALCFKLKQRSLLLSGSKLSFVLHNNFLECHFNFDSNAFQEQFNDSDIFPSLKQLHFVYEAVFMP